VGARAPANIFFKIDEGLNASSDHLPKFFFFYVGKVGWSVKPAPG
jgi:hypothetical protein